MAGLEDAFGRIGAAAEEHLPRTHGAGLALAITDVDDTLGAVVRGFADVASGRPVLPDTRFQIGSIGKSFASLLVLQEEAKGTLALDFSVNELLPWLELPEPFGPITLHHLMTHTSGLIGGTLASPWGKADALHVRRTPPLIPPGSRYRYSNLGYQIVGHVLERATGTPIHELLLERILGPLGMTRSTGAITDEDRLDASVGYEPVVADRVPHGESPLGPAIWQPSNTADGSIISTAPDLCAYARMILAQGRGLLAPEAFARWTAAYVESDEPDSPYGYGWGVTRRDGRRVLWHTGGTVGFTAILEIRPDDGLAVAICQNGGGEKGALAAFALAAVEAALRGTEPPPPPEPLRPAADAAGTYAGPDRTFRIEETAAGAVVHAGPLAVPLQPLGTDPDELVGAHPALDRYPVRVLREDGRVVGLAHGPARYTAAGGEAMPAAEDPPAWAGLTGLYRSDSPWTRALRVYPREGRLYLLEIANGEESELIASEGDRFAVGDAGLPDRVRFLDPIGGAAQTLDYDGASFTRSFET